MHMQSALRKTTRVLPGGLVTISDPQLKEGQTVEVIVLAQPATSSSEQGKTAGAVSVLDFLDSLPKFEQPPGYWEEREREFQRERDSWDR